MGLNKINVETTWSKAASDINSNFDSINAELISVKNATTNNKGYFSSGDALRAMFPSGNINQIAYVGSSYPYAIWKWNGSQWYNTGQTGGSESVALGNYHTADYVDEKLSELGSYQGCIRVKGQGTTGVTGIMRSIAKGRTYRVIPQVQSWNTSGIPDTSLVFELYTVNVDGNPYVAYSRANNEAGKRYYDITVPETTNLDRGLNVYLRAASGTKCVFLVEDITDAFNEDAMITTGVTSIKAISSFRPSNLVNGDIYYNSSYKVLIKITTEGNKEFVPSLSGLYVLDGIYYRWDGSDLSPIDKKEVYGGVMPIAIGTQTILPSNGNYLNLNVPEGGELDCIIKVKINGTAEYQVSLILSDNSQKLVQNWTTASTSEIPCKIPSGAKSVLVYCSSSSNGTVGITVNAIIQPVTKVAADAMYAKDEVVKKVDTMAIGYGYGTNYNVKSLWEQGHFRDDGSKGDESAAFYQKKIRTGYLPNEVQDIKVKAGYTYNLFKYTKSGVFVSMSMDSVGDGLDFDNYQYKMEISKTSQMSIDVSAYDNALLLANPISIGGGSGGSIESSVYKKNVNWGMCPSEYYECQQTDYSFGEQYNSSKRVIEMFDTLPMVKANIGTASDGQSMYSYTLSATRPTITGTCSDAKKMPKIIIVAGQHGFEKNAMYATYYLMKDLCENTSKSEVLRWMRSNIDFVVIPCANPWGVDNYKYTNANNVNLNRNWGVENWAATVTDTTSEQYQGAAAFDQPETRAIRDVILDNKDASLIVDFHTNGGTIVTKNNINWLSLQNPSDNDSFYARFRDVAIAHLINISSKFNIAYKAEIGGTVDEICGKITSNAPDEIGYLESYAVEQGFFGLTFEGCNQFPNESVILSAKVKKANAELLGNYILMFATLISK